MYFAFNINDEDAHDEDFDSDFDTTDKLNLFSCWLQIMRSIPWLWQLQRHTKCNLPVNHKYQKWKPNLFI